MKHPSLSVVLATLALTGCLSTCTQPHVPDTRPANACDAGAFVPGEHVLNIQMEDRPRRAIVHFPSGPGPHDVVVNLHEFRSSPRTQVRYTDWIRFGEENNVIVVGPDGRYATWNAGACCGKARNKNIKDGPFLDAVVAKLDEVACTSGRVLATGIGNGGMMAHRWACESDVVDGVVSVGGALQQDTCAMKRPIPMLHFHGDADTWMPADGSGNHLPVAHALEQWSERNRITGEQQEASGDLACRHFEGAAPMAYCVVKGGHDGWPGAADLPVQTASPLGDATRGGWAWMQEAWRE